MKTPTRRQQVREIERQLDAMASRVQDNMKEVGILLYKLQVLGEPVNKYQKRLKERYSIDIAASSVALRWAEGQYGNDDDAIRKLVAVVKPSAVRQTPASRVVDSLSCPQTIISDGRPVTKMFAQMTPGEIKTNWVPGEGFRSLEKMIKSGPMQPSVYEWVASDGYISPDGNGAVVVVKNVKAIYRIRVSPGIVAKMAAGLVIPSSSGADHRDRPVA